MLAAARSLNFELFVQARDTFRERALEQRGSRVNKQFKLHSRRDTNLITMTHQLQTQRRLVLRPEEAQVVGTNPGFQQHTFKSSQNGFNAPLHRKNRCSFHLTSSSSTRSTIIRHLDEHATVILLKQTRQPSLVVLQGIQRHEFTCRHKPLALSTGLFANLCSLTVTLSPRQRRICEHDMANVQS